MSLSDSVRRAARTFVQSFIGTLIGTGVLSAASVDGVVDWSAAGKAGVAGVAAGIVAVLSWLQNALEDAEVISPLLKHEAVGD